MLSNISLNLPLIYDGDANNHVGLEASFNSLISAKDGGYIMIGSKKGQVWLAEFDVQQGGSIPLQLLPYVVVLLVIAFAATVLVAVKTGRVFQLFNKNR